MNRVVLIGNGFDLAHGLPTRYEDFINWYWDERVKKLMTLNKRTSEDKLCKLILSDTSHTWSSYLYYLPINNNKSFRNPLKYIKETYDAFENISTPFFHNIITSVETKGWVDIENEYYKLLKETALMHYSIRQTKELNDQLQYVEDLLVNYLTIVNQTQVGVQEMLRDKIYSPIKLRDVSIEGTSWFKDDFKQFLSCDDIVWKEKMTKYGLSDDCYGEANEYKPAFGRIKPSGYPDLFLLPDNIMFVNFNYTTTVDPYINNTVSSQVHIHGELSNPKGIIFGYGDEKDSDYSNLQKLNENECLQKIKSIKYLESDNYRKVLSFVDSAPFQIFIMGHSCGNSDRTLLNTLFEHKNCFSIKPFYYINKDTGKDNYLDLVQNISRNFTDMKLMRDRVVNKTYCETIV